MVELRFPKKHAPEIAAVAYELGRAWMSLAASLLDHDWEDASLASQRVDRAQASFRETLIRLGIEH